VHIRIQTYISILHYSFLPFIYLHLSSMYKNNFDYIINPRLVSVLFSRLRRVSGANRSIITWRRKEKGEREKEETGKNWHPCMFCIYLSIFVSKENKGSTIEKERKTERERQHNVAVDAASASFSLPMSWRGVPIIVDIVVVTKMYTIDKSIC
jgi:hypothetical protein